MVSTVTAPVPRQPGDQPANRDGARPTNRPRRAGPPAGRRGGRARLLRELTLVAVFYAAYSLIRTLVPHGAHHAIRHARQVLGFEHHAGIAIEHALNVNLIGSPTLSRLADHYYATFHFMITFAVVAWLFVRRPDRYERLRTALMVATGLALLGFWLYPLAPPRLVPGAGFIDPVTAFHTWGLYSASATQDITNQYAAMPSMHAGWALWCAIVVISLTRRWWLRALAALYPAVTIYVIIATANHYVVDVAVGTALIGAGFAVAALLARVPARGPVGALLGCGSQPVADRRGARPDRRERQAQATGERRVVDDERGARAGLGDRVGHVEHGDGLVGDHQLQR